MENESPIKFGRDGERMVNGGPSSSSSSSSSSTIHRKTITKEYDTTPTRPSSYGHSLVITRTSGGGGNLGSSTPRRNVGLERSANVYNGAPIGMYSTVTTAGVNSVKETRENERKDMQDLNDRFANYLDKVRFLEVQNRKLADDLEKLKTKWGKETAQVKALYQVELDEARKELDDLLKEKAKIEIKVTTITEEIDEIQMRLTDTLKLKSDTDGQVLINAQLIIDYENQLQQLRKSIDTMVTEREKIRNLIAQIEETLRKAREDLDAETLNHIDAENRRQTLEEEIEFLKRLHEQEMSEMASLAYTESSPESRDFWKTEMAQAISEIQQMYEDKMGDMKVQMETQYNRKVQEFAVGKEKEAAEATKSKQESTQMRTDLTDLRDKLGKLSDSNVQLERELESLRRMKEDRERELDHRNSDLNSEAANLKRDLDGILRQLQQVLDTKLTLELEIAAYRKLLEGEENRLNRNDELDSMRSIVTESSMGTSSSGEMKAKTSFTTSAKGAMAFNECTPNGKCIKIENKGKKAESLSGWKIRRSVDGREIDEFVFEPERYDRIDPGKIVCVYAKGMKPKWGHAIDTEAEVETWGIGTKVLTKLINSEGKECATHTQTTVYSY